MKSALNNLVIYRGGNNECDIQVAVLAELLADNLGIDQARDYDRCRPDRTVSESAGSNGSMVDGYADPQSRPAISIAVDCCDRSGQPPRIVGNQG